jgi:solute carrier family 25 carnitine/acylcarnitine transporter 20/29
MPNDYIYGLCGGFVGTLLSHPIDTIKTRLQTGTSLYFKDAIIKGNLYKGLSAPLLGIGFEKLIVFGFYNECKKLELSDGFSGLIAGFLSTVIVVPIDRIKILMQNKENINKSIFKPSSLYKGFSITLFRETPGFGIYFTTYNKLTNRFNKEQNLLKSFLFGSLSGFTSWIFIYPSDLIKTRFQSIKNNQETTIKTVISQIYNKNGLCGFYNGFQYAIMRAIPLHGGVFLGYELSKRYFSKM